MSIRISSRSKATPQVYNSEDEEHSDDSRQEELDSNRRSSRRRARRSVESDDEGDEGDRTSHRRLDRGSDIERDNEVNTYQNGTSSDTGQHRKSSNVSNEGQIEPPSVANKPTSILPVIMAKPPKNWPPPAPKKYDAFAVEGHGRVNPYTGEVIPYKVDETPPPEEDKRLEIDDGHVRPVNELKKTWQGGKQAPRLGVQKPQAVVQGNKSWIKHEKPPVEYEEPPKDPDWLNLVRNRRWKSTVKARFPCQNKDIVDFERRSTTPKNWKRLLLDKKAVRTIGEITGIGAEGEELLWRLAKQRGKVDDGGPDTQPLPIPGEQDTLAYEHIKKNLEDAVVEAAIQAGIDPNEYPGDSESVMSLDTGDMDGRSVKTSASTAITTTALRQRLLRLHPEEFKKLLALDRARDAHLRWQFSTDPYDSVHEHQLQPFEMALLSGDRENRLRYLLKRLLKVESMTPSGTSSGRATPVYGRGRSLSASCNASDIESDSGSSVTSARRSRSKKKPPVPLPRKGRSVSPSYRKQKDEEVHGFLGPEDEHITAELKKLEDMTQGMGLPPEISDLLNKRSGRSDDRRERPEDSITMGLDDRMRNFLKDSNENVPKKEQPEELITQSLLDRKMSFLDEAQRAAAPRRGDESDFDDLDGRMSDIDTDEISSRRRRFLDQEKKARAGGGLPEKEKKRHKVQRIKSDAELYAVMSKRRIATDDEETEETVENRDHSSEMKGILEDITKTFGGQTYTRIGKRKPRFQSSDEGDSTQISESQEDEAPARKPSIRNRDARNNNGGNRRQRRERTRDWSSDESDDEDKDER